MQIKTLLLALLTSVTLFFMTLPAQAALLDRDLDHNGLTDAFYDTDLNITWLRDANINGSMEWSAAKVWAENLVFAGYSDWRLPINVETWCTGFNCSLSEMGHLFYSELYNVGGLTNSGSFDRLQSGFYWSGTESLSSNQDAWYFANTLGYQGSQNKGLQFYAMAVRQGDVLTAVPEPETFSMMLVGLVLLSFLAFRRRSNS